MRPFASAGPLVVLLAAFIAPPAVAERVVVLELSGDRGGALRGQIEGALEASGRVELLPLKRFRDEAARKGFRGAEAMTPEALAAVAPGLGLDAAVSGTVAAKYSVVILDAAGEQLWSRDIPVTRGRISADHARRLAAAIEVAAKKGSARRSELARRSETGTPPPEDDTTIGQVPEVAEAAPRPPVGSAEKIPAVPEVTAGKEERRPPSIDRAPGPPMFTLGVQGTTSWRTYCARPGVPSCRDYDLLEEGNLPAGSPRQFDTSFPYTGAKVTVELFPAAGLEGFVRGLGFVGDLRFGLSITDVFNVVGDVRTRIGTELAQDRGFTAALTWRHYFSFGFDPDRAGYAGVRAGMAGRGFRVGGAVVNQVPPTDRIFPEAAIDVSLPFNRWARVDASAGYSISPTVAPDDYVAYGVATRASGWSAAIGLSGDLWGMLGYVLRFEHAQFHDEFQGDGTDWTDGGVATETYSSIVWGITLGF